MIGLLRGQVLWRQPPHLLLEVNGVGYEVEAPMSTFFDLPLDSGTVTLYTHMMVREDAHTLYGFLRESERALFRTLLKVNGVGGKMALAILSSMGADEFCLSIQSADIASLTRVPGVGKKTAERLVVEMRDRLDGLSVATKGSGSKAALTAAPSGESDAIAALLALGYKPADAARMVRDVFAEDMATEDLIKAALKSSMRG